MLMLGVVLQFGTLQQEAAPNQSYQLIGLIFPVPKELPLQPLALIFRNQPIQLHLKRRP
jgi:hypothetical protein